jgi:hypothetical protein
LPVATESCAPRCPEPCGCLMKGPGKRTHCQACKGCGHSKKQSLAAPISHNEPAIVRLTNRYHCRTMGRGHRRQIGTIDGIFLQSRLPLSGPAEYSSSWVSTRRLRQSGAGCARSLRVLLDEDGRLIPRNEISRLQLCTIKSPRLLCAEWKCTS